MDSNKLINGRILADSLLSMISASSNTYFKSFCRQPCLAVIIVGDDPASKIYVTNKIKTAKLVDIQSIELILPKDVTEKKLLNEIDKLNDNPEVDGILVQLPLPKHISEKRVINKIFYKKDVDGFNPINFGNLILGHDTIIPCTPLGCLYLIKNEIENLEGYNVTIIGRSNIVGKPLQALLLKENCTVTIAHSKTKELKSISKNADILVTAIGKPELITKDYIKKNSLIIDVGINRITREGKSKLVGDIKFDDAFFRG